MAHRTLTKYVHVPFYRITSSPNCLVDGTTNTKLFQSTFRAFSTPGKSPNGEFTLALLKPDLCADPYAVKRVLLEIEKLSTPQSPINIVARKEFFWTKEDANGFYAVHEGRFFFERLTGYMTSGPFQALVLQGDDIILKWRKLIGPTHPVRAKLASNFTLRSLLGLTDTRNSFHGSDSVSNARTEIKYFFPELKL